LELGICCSSPLWIHLRTSAVKSIQLLRGFTVQRSVGRLTVLAGTCILSRQKMQPSELQIGLDHEVEETGFRYFSVKIALLGSLTARRVSSDNEGVYPHSSSLV